MSEHIDWELLTMYVFGECSEDQKREVENWLAEDPVRDGILDDLRKVYSDTGKTPSQRARDERRQDRTWAQVQAHMQQEADLEQAVDPSPTTGRSARHGRLSRRFNRSASRVAAILAVVAFSVVLATQLEPVWLSDPASEAKVFVTQRGERATIRLADSTRVHLNADSRLEILPGFEADTREVQLRGEAYFEVAPDARHPFLVHAGAATTEVLGTEFTVNAYSESVEVVVAGGQVAFRPNDATSQKGTQEEAVLVRKQAARLSPGRQPMVREVDLDPHLAWLSGEIVFEDAAFDEVARQLERRYDIDVSLVGSAVLGQLTARFSEEQPLDKVLTVVASVFDLKYKREGRGVKFSPLGQ